MHYVYMLQCADGTYYTGYTVDLDKRLRTHQAGKGAKYTRSHLPVELVFWEEHAGKGEALSREIELKGLSHQAKAALANQFVTPPLTPDGPS